MKLEKRYLPFDTAELRVEPRADGKPGTLIGYAAVYDSLSEDLGYFRERIRTGAFTLALDRNPDCRALVNHDANLLIGRNRSGTLRLQNTQKGLRVECDLPDTSYARDLVECIGRRDMTGMSFGFQCRADEWSEELVDKQPCMIRELLDLDIFDVSAVTYPAYPDTEMGLRSLEAWKKQQPPATHLLRRRLEIEELG